MTVYEDSRRTDFCFGEEARVIGGLIAQRTKAHLSEVTVNREP